MSKGSTETETTERRDPWGPAQPALKNVLDEASSLYQNQPNFYPGQTFAGLNDLQMQGLSSGLQYGQNTAPELIGNAQGAWQGALNSPDVANNPYVEGMLQQQQRLAGRNFNENILPGITDQYVDAGQLGGSRQGVAQGIAARGMQESLLNQQASTQMQAYGQGLTAQGNALGMTDPILQSGFVPSQTTMNVGNELNQESQRYIDESMARYNAPWDQLNRYSSVANQVAGQGGTGVSTTETPSGGILGSLMSLGLAAAKR